MDPMNRIDETLGRMCGSICAMAPIASIGSMASIDLRTCHQHRTDTRRSVGHDGTHCVVAGVAETQPESDALPSARVVWHCVAKDYSLRGSRLMQQSSATSWFAVRDGRQHGPISDQEMHVLVARGLLKPTDMIWREGFPDWQPVHSVFQPAQAAPPPIPPAPPQPPPIRQNRPAEQQPAQLSGADDTSEARQVGDYKITFKSGVVRDIQHITKISSHTSGGGGMIQGGSGYISSPSVSVTSHVTQRAFVIDDRGGEWYFWTGDHFAVRVGNRVRVGWVSRKGRKSIFGLVKNMDTGEHEKGSWKRLLPGYWWHCLVFLIGFITYMALTRIPQDSPAGRLIIGVFFGSEYVADTVAWALYFYGKFALGAAVAWRFIQRKRITDELTAAMLK